MLLRRAQDHIRQHVDRRCRRHANTAKLGNLDHRPLTKRELLDERFERADLWAVEVANRRYRAFSG